MRTDQVSQLNGSAVNSQLSATLAIRHQKTAIIQATETGTDFRTSVALDRPPCSIIRHPRLSTNAPDGGGYSRVDCSAIVTNMGIFVPSLSILELQPHDKLQAPLTGSRAENVEHLTLCDMISFVLNIDSREKNPRYFAFPFSAEHFTSS